MAKGMPSMVALLGLLAVAGYQNRDKLGSVLGNVGGTPGPNGVGSGRGGLGDMLGGLAGGSAGAGGLGGLLSGGLGDLVERFTGAGQGQKAQSWIREGENESVAPSDLERTLGDETIAELQQQTGLSKAELLERLATVLPDAVNRLTPAGRLPTADEAAAL